MHLTYDDMGQLDKVKRLNIINSITGIKPANLIGTRSAQGQSNLAIFSSVVHLGSNPALLGFVMRPAGAEVRHTYENIRDTGYYTINHVHHRLVAQAHCTSAKFDRAVSEFAQCGFTEAYIADFPAPFVAESPVKIGLQLKDEIPIALNNTILLIGEVQHLLVPDEAVDAEGHIDLTSLGSAGISGLNSYYQLQRHAQFPYARPEDVEAIINTNNYQGQPFGNKLV